MIVQKKLNFVQILFDEIGLLYNYKIDLGIHALKLSDFASFAEK